MRAIVALSAARSPTRGSRHSSVVHSVSCAKARRNSGSDSSTRPRSASVTACQYTSSPFTALSGSIVPASAYRSRAESTFPAVR
jgi:hypothetical protein